jgi:hypothetical protein
MFNLNKLPDWHWKEFCVAIKECGVLKITIGQRQLDSLSQERRHQLQMFVDRNKQIIISLRLRHCLFKNAK